MKYPLFLDLKNEPVVVVGAGKVAVRKIQTLLKAGARVTVVSPVALAAVKNWAKAKRVTWVRRVYQRGDLAGARLVIAATDDLAVNEKVSAEARGRKLLVNCIAPPAAGNFIVPSRIERGRLTIAISTDGASPAFAKRLRLDLERFLDRGYAGLLDEMSAARRAKKQTK